MHQAVHSVVFHRPIVEQAIQKAQRLFQKYFKRTLLTSLLLMGLNNPTAFAHLPTLEELREIGKRINQGLSTEKKDIIVGLATELSTVNHELNLLRQRMEPEVFDTDVEVAALDEKMGKLMGMMAQQLVGIEGAGQEGMRVRGSGMERVAGSDEELLGVLDDHPLVGGIGWEERDGRDPTARQSCACFSRYKKQIVASCLAAATAVCVVGAGVFASEWVQAGLLATGAAVLYSTSGIIGNRIPLPDGMGRYSKLALRSLIGAALVFPGNLLGYAGVQIALAPGSTVNIVATNAWLVFVNELTSTLGALVFLDQPSNWPTWVGIVAMGSVAGLQAWHAIQNPRPMGGGH